MEKETKNILSNEYVNAFSSGFIIKAGKKAAQIFAETNYLKWANREFLKEFGTFAECYGMDNDMREHKTCFGAKSNLYSDFNDSEASENLEKICDEIIENDEYQSDY